MTVLRELTAYDVALVREAMLRTVKWREVAASVTLDVVHANMPYLSRFVEDFGRTGDAGLVAESNGSIAGIAWFRIFDSETPGSGLHRRVSTPELLGIAVWPQVSSLQGVSVPHS